MLGVIGKAGKRVRGARDVVFRTEQVWVKDFVKVSCGVHRGGEGEREREREVVD